MQHDGKTLPELIDESTDFVRSRSDFTPEIGVILGTGLGALAEEIDVDVSIPYSDIPHVPTSTVSSHEGALVLGQLSGKPVVAMKGRVHYYEGYSMKEITHPVRVMKGLGADRIIISNACGSMNPFIVPGDIVIVADHINLMGDNPLIGPNYEELGPRFPDMAEAYAPELVELAEEVARDEKITVRKGVLAAVAGPNLETAAEYRFLRRIGADIVSMSMVPENIVAVHSGMRVLGLSAITDACLPDALGSATLEEILKVANSISPVLTKLVDKIVERM
jgi:purine-nucleoside phosphorylase